MKKHSIVAVAGLAALVLTLNANFAQAQGPGSPDPGFGTGGILNASFTGGLAGFPANFFEEANGELVVVLVAAQTTSNQTTNGVALVHYKPNGQLDTAFGNGGTTYVALGNSTNIVAAAQDAEGNIVLATTPITGPSSAAGLPLTGIGAVRLTPNGQLDTTFGDGGIVVTSLGNGRVSASNLVLQPNGQIVISGGELGLSRIQKVQTVLVRYNHDGSLDTTFGTGGIVQEVTAGAGPGSPIVLLENGDYLAISGQTEVEYSPTGALMSSVVTAAPVAVSTNSELLFQSNGNFIAASSVAPPPGSGTPDVTRGRRPSFVQVAEFSETGAAVSTFNTTTFSYVPITSSNVDEVDISGADQVAFSPNGQIIVAGGVTGTDPNAMLKLAVARLNADGGLDASFGTGGTITGAVSQGISGLLVQNDGKIVVWYLQPRQSSSSGSTADFVLERFLAN